jgi:hypothetical protein
VTYSDTIGQRSILTEQLLDALQVSDARSGVDVDGCAAGAEVSEDLGRSRRDIPGHIAPASIGIVAVSELNRARTIPSSRIDVSAARKQLVDDGEPPRHRCPVNRLIASGIAGMQQVGRYVEDRLRTGDVAVANGGGDGLARR